MREGSPGARPIDRTARIRDALAESEVFRGIDRDALESYIPVMRWREYDRDATIVEPSRGAGGAMVIACGAARVFRVSPSGREITLAEFAVGDVFGLSYLSPVVDERSTMVAAGVETAVCTIPCPPNRVKSSFMRRRTMLPRVQGCWQQAATLRQSA